MLYAVLIALILLMLWPLLAEVRMVLRSILNSCFGSKAVPALLAEQPALRRLTLSGLTARLPKLRREYGQYLRLQLLPVIAAAVCIALVVLFIGLRWIVPALIVTFGFDIAAFAGISVIHAHAGYDPDTRTTRYDRHGK